MFKSNFTPVNVDTITASAYRVARETPPEKFIGWCLDQINVGFATSAAMWNLAVPLNSHLSPDNDTRQVTRPASIGNKIYGRLSGENLRTEISGVRCAFENVELFCSDYKQVEFSHPLLPVIVTNPSRSYSFDVLSEAALNSTELDAKFVQFSQRYGLTKSLAIACPIPRTKNLNVFLLWRRKIDPPFSSVDISFLERMVAHLSQALQHSRTFAVSSRMLEFWDRHNAVMTLNDNGFLVDVDERFERVIGRNWPGSSTSNLPDELKTLLDPESQGNFRKGDILFSRYYIDAHRIVVATELGDLAALTQRELEISMLFANGNDHKSIAENINRSSSTVRNHLRNIYHKLGIRSRSELVDRLQRLTSMPQ